MTLLSTNYQNRNQNLELKCSNCEYIFIVPFKIINNRVISCTNCCERTKTTGIKYTFEDIKKYVNNERPDLILLSSEYVNSKTKLKWKCSDTDCNNLWENDMNHIRSRNQGCPKIQSTNSKTWENKPGKLSTESQKYF